MRKLAAAAALALMTWCPGAVGQDQAGESCTRSLSDLSEVIDCLARIPTARPFNDATGQACATLESTTFVRPAQGKLVMRYGEASPYGNRSKGVVIETANAGQVVAPADSLVLYVDEFRSYGRILILEPGCGARFLIAGLSATSVARGQIVRAGEAVGVMASGSSPGYAPVLYVEFRRDDRPVDPGPDITGQ